MLCIFAAVNVLLQSDLVFWFRASMQIAFSCNLDSSNVNDVCEVPMM